MSALLRATVCLSSNHDGGSTTTDGDPTGYGNDMCKSVLSAPHSEDEVNNTIVSTTRVLAELSVVEIQLSEALRSTHVHFSNQQVAGYSSVIIETVNYFVEGGSNVYGCFLDASKAFDKVHYGKLFSLLMSKGLPNVVVRFVLDG